ncbi:MAG: Hsp20/alpha crystallin family protein [Candidatus Heimdallarchaeota archaeon]|nr:Hsp20/alpha crystallin family protein [Candidatus Heimdallarchaeota archaeon]
MSLVRFNNSPMREFARLIENSNYMPVDLLESEDEYIVKAEVPGYSSEDVSVELTPEALIIRAGVEKESTSENEDQDTGYKYLHRELYQESLTRKVKFRTLVDTKNATSKLENGILTINLPKSEDAKPVKLTIS